MSGVPQGSILGPLLFLIFFNDFPDYLIESKVIKFADDTILYVSHSDIYTIETILNKEMERLYTYFHENELVLNLKKGKTETMLFGTSKRLSMSSKSSLNISYNGSNILETNSYTYLGNVLDPCLTLNDNFERSYKKASGRLNLLMKMRRFLNIEAATKIYEMVIMPILTYGSLISLKINRTQQQKLQSIERRATQIIGGNTIVPSIEGTIKKRACVFVKKCLMKSTCKSFANYFVINNHTANTRNRNQLLILPKVRLEYGKQAFKFMGAKTYNELPLEIRSCESLSTFKRLLHDF